VLLSIASAVNWLEQRSTLTEDTVVQWFQASGHAGLDFATARSVVLPNFPNIEAIEYHDQHNPPPDVDALLDRVRTGGVLVLSLEIADPSGTTAHRRGRWHMISVFRSGGVDAQVWDTNGHAGFLTWPEVRELLSGDTLAIPYPPVGFLLPHGQHHCLLIHRR
jgi:hypothetical protein